MLKKNACHYVTIILAVNNTLLAINEHGLMKSEILEYLSWTELILDYNNY